MAKLRADTRENDLIHTRSAVAPPRTNSLVLAKPAVAPVSPAGK